ncbi:hypothetical protein KEM52_003449, partial [Ascosphaera acerosa]
YVFFGANDACLPGNYQHVPLANYKAALRRIATHPYVTAQQTKVLLLTPPPVNEHQFADAHPPRVAWHTKQYADACRAVGAALGVPVVDVWGAFMRYAGWQGQEGGPFEGSRELPENPRLRELLSDGLHLTPVGYRVVYDEVKRVIAQVYPEETPEKLQPKFASWTEVPRPRVEE